MSVQTQLKRITVPEIRAHKGDKPVVCLTCYHAHTARLLDNHVDLMLVGDSLGMVMHGLENTLGVTLDMMITHAKAVMRGSKRALVVVDMPFGTYEESPAIAFRNAARIIQETGATAVKLEGGTRMAETIHYLTERGIPVMGHIGLTPQMVNVKGGFRTTGRTRRGMAGAGSRCQGGGRGRRLCRGAGRHGRTPGRQDHRPRSPFPPSASAPRPPATARCW